MSLFPQMLLDLNQELIIDLFAGGGGASCGIEMGLGRQVDVAINHDAAAVALHQANHPQTKHHVCDVFEVDPREVAQGRPIGLLWASPDCTDFSKAKGGKPIRTKKRRALAWVVKRWAGQVRPRVIMLENVEEFVTWGPLVGKPGDLRRCEKRKGKTFRRFVRELKALGYAVEWRELRACDFGAPTIRKRLFLIARCDGRPIVWPQPTHGKGKGLKPFRTAAECIDWSIPMLSIFATKTEARAWGKAHQQAAPKRPLASATMRRIARGVVRYVIQNPKPFIVGVGGRQGQSPERPLGEPYQTITAKGDSALVAPLTMPLTHQGDLRSHRVTDPLPTVTGAQRGEQALVAPYLVPNNTNNVPQSVESPAPTVTGGGRNILAAPYLVPRYGEREGQEPRTRSIEDPMPVVVPDGNGGSLAAVHLSSYHAEKREGDVRGAEPAAPIATLDTSNRHALVAGFLAQNNEGDRPMNGRDLNDPNGTICVSGSHQSLVAATLTKLRGTSSDADPAEPLHTISAGGEHHGIAAAHLSHFQTHDPDGGEGSPEQPLRAITGRSKAGVVAAFLQSYYGVETRGEADRPLNTIPTRDRFGLVTVDVAGVAHVIVDIAMRMLQPRELYNAQGFPRSYRIDRGADGRPLTKTEQVRMCGNSVSPVHPMTMVRANLPELMVRDAVKRSA